MKLFDPQKILKTRMESHGSFDQHDFIFRHVEEELLHRILFFCHSGELGEEPVLSPGSNVLVCGERLGIITKALAVKGIFTQTYPHSCANLDLAGPFDAVLDIMNLHTINDVPGALSCYRRLLGAKGVFLASFCGGRTLTELRSSLVNAELELNGGAALRVIPMIDLATASALLQGAGFGEPVVDREVLKIAYPSLVSLLRDIRGMGCHQPFLDPPSPMSYRLFRNSEAWYRAHCSREDERQPGKIHATAEIIYMKGFFSLK